MRRIAQRVQPVCNCIARLDAFILSWVLKYRYVVYVKYPLVNIVG
jgi:hypothetical protein